MCLADLLPEHREIPPPNVPLDGKRYPAHGAVYVITDGDDRFIQLAAGENLRRTLLNRLRPGEPEHKSPRADLRAIARNVRFIPTHSQFETMFQFHRCARHLLPDQYLDQVAFGPSWFVHVDPEEEFPRFVPTPRPYGKPGSVVGPFPRRVAAVRFVEQIEDLFDLCRYHDVLRQAPAGEPCAYFEMGKCAAPCDGSIPMSQYQADVARASDFAAGHRDAFRQSIEQRMEQAAQTLAFEQAASLKQTLERSRQFEAREFRLVMPLEKLDYLIIQRGPGRSRVKPFFIRGGRITPGESVTARELAGAVPAWIDAARREPPPSDAPVGEDYRTEQVWLVCHFLFKADRAPGLYLRTDQFGSPERLVERIRDAFRLSAGRARGDGDPVIDSAQGASKMPHVPGP